jgi:hypothetical protein
VTDICAAITKEFFENEVCAMYATRPNSIACPSFGVIQQPTGESSDAI